MTTESVLAQLSPKVRQARVAYESFVRDGMGEGRRNEFHCGTCEGRILGDDLFADEVLLRANQRGEHEYTLDEVIHTVCSHYSIGENELSAPGKIRPMTEARAVAAAIVQASPHLQLVALGRLLNRDISALGKAAQRSATDDRLRAVVSAIKKQLSARPVGMSEPPA